MNVISIPVFRPGPFAVDQYHQMVEKGLLSEDAPVELVEGWIIPKMPNSPRHYGTIQRISRKLETVLPKGWVIRIQGPITTSDSEPEPDLVVARDDGNDYLSKHPSPADIGLLIEVSLTTPGFDRTNKARVYARAGIPQYWVVDLDRERIEELSDPDSSEPDPHFRSANVKSKVAEIPLILAGQEIAVVPVADLLP
jgi:Uma2 family endonuclease